MREPTLGLYLSIPFCRAKCTFCNFASGAFGEAAHGQYLDRLCADMQASRAFAEEHSLSLPREVTSVYLGGGTPSTLSAAHFALLFRTLRREFSVATDAEITVECAPGTLSDAFLAAMLESGVNRVSLGVQSFIDGEARAVGRTHTREIAIADITRLRRAGIPNLCVDLIAGLPHQTESSWLESRGVLVDSGVDHASLYMLEIDDDSRLGRELLTGGTRYGAGLVPTDDTVASMYETGCHHLNAAGLSQYELSNFARPGAESRHNHRYWLLEPYLGLGLDAHSMLRDHAGHAVRFNTPDDLPGYMSRTGTTAPTTLSAFDELQETWFLGLRLNAGVDLSVLRDTFGAQIVSEFIPTLRVLADDGLIDRRGDHVALTARGRLLSNEAFTSLLTVGEPLLKAVPV